MNARWCHRCHEELAAPEDGTLRFCPHCGAPQIRIAEELLRGADPSAETAADSSLPDADAGAAAPASAADATRARDALKLAALSASVSGGLALLSTVFGAFLLFDFIWVLVSPVVLLGILQARRPGVPVTPGFGSRLGFLAGIANAAVLGAMFAVTLFTERHAHLLGSYDANMTQSIRAMQAQVTAQIAAQGGNTADFRLLNALTVPEFRAGLLLSGAGLMTAILLAISTVGGAFGGFMRSRRA